MSTPRSVGFRHQPRFAQLTYASTDQDGRARGWQVLDTTGDLTPCEQEFLTRQITTRFTPATEVPTYLAAEEARALPRRLVHAPGPDGATAYWHTTPCGSDAQGRPGNVFVHVLLDRTTHPAGPSPQRPSDLCGSPHWLRPFGQDEVAAAALEEVPEPPWEPAPGRAEVLSFLFGSASPDVGVFCLLLDAVYAAMSGGPRVVFGVRTEESGQHWIATVSHMMSPGAARRFYWSTSERLAERQSWPGEVHLVVVPYEDLTDCGPLEQLVLLSEDEQVRRADPGHGPRMTRNGSSVAVTTWSAMAYEMSALPERAAAVLSRLDDIAAVVGDVGLDPAWPMAMVLATMPETFADAMATTRRVLGTRSPQHLASKRELYTHVLELAGTEAGATTQDAWNAVRQAPAGTWRAVLRDLYLLRALGDESWLARPGTPGTDEQLVPAQKPPVAEAVRERAAGLMRSLHRRIQDDADISCPAAVATVVVRFTDMLHNHRVDFEQAARGPTRLDDLWIWVIDRVVLVPKPRERLLEVLAGQLGPAARDRFARTLTQHLRTGKGRAGTRVPIMVQDLLGTRLPRPHELGPSRSPTLLQRELAACLTLVDPDPWSLAWLVHVWGLLDQGDDSNELARLVDTEETGRPAHLTVLLDHRRHTLILEFVRRTLLRAPPGADTGDLVAAVLRAGTGRMPMRLHAVAELRQSADRDAGTPAGRVRLLTLIDEVLATLPPDSVTPSVWRAVLAAYTAEMLRRAWYQDPETADEQLPVPVAHALREQAAEPDGNEWSARTLARYPDVPNAALVHAALWLRLQTEDPAAGGNRLRRLATVVVTGHGALSIVDRAVALRHRAGQLDENGRDDGHRRFRQDLRSPERARTRRRFATGGEDIDTVCRTWWAQVTSAGSHAMTTTRPTPWRGGY